MSYHYLHVFSRNTVEALSAYQPCVSTKWIAHGEMNSVIFFRRADALIRMIALLLSKRVFFPQVNHLRLAYCDFNGPERVPFVSLIGTERCPEPYEVLLDWLCPQRIKHDRICERVWEVALSFSQLCSPNSCADWGAVVVQASSGRGRPKQRHPHKNLVVWPFRLRHPRNSRF